MLLTTRLGQSFDGELFIYNWTEYTPPELIAKFEKESGIKVSVDTYDSNETLLAKLQAGATGYDIVVPSQNFVPIMINEGLIQKVGVHKLPNFKNMKDQAGNFRNGIPNRSTPVPGNGAPRRFPITVNSIPAKASR